jgi:hypothetical protein
VKQVLQGIFSGLGLFGLMVVILSFILFSFYLQLVIAKSKENLQTLLALGYSPKWLGQRITGQMIPIYILIILFALLFVQLLQYIFYHWVMNDRPELSSFINIMTFEVALMIFLLSYLANSRLVKKILYQLQ